MQKVFAQTAITGKSGTVRLLTKIVRANRVRLRVAPQSLSPKVTATGITGNTMSAASQHQSDSNIGAMQTSTRSINHTVGRSGKTRNTAVSLLSGTIFGDLLKVLGIALAQPIALFARFVESRLVRTTLNGKKKLRHWHLKAMPTARPTRAHTGSLTRVRRKIVISESRMASNYLNTRLLAPPKVGCAPFVVVAKHRSAITINGYAPLRSIIAIPLGRFAGSYALLATVPLVGLKIHQKFCALLSRISKNINLPTMLHSAVAFSGCGRVTAGV